MLIHNFKYALKTLFRDKMLIFWTFAFPIILGTFFNMSFSNIENSEKLEIIDIAIVDNDEFQNNELYKEAFKTLSDEENEDRLFNTKYVTEEGAKKLLEENKIIGFMILEEDNPKVVVTTSGINETILKYVVEEITTNGQIVESLMDKEINKELGSGVYNLYNLDYEKIYKNLLEKTQNQEVKVTDISNNNLSYTMIEFYTLIAMACLYGGILGMVAINKNLANMSSNGKRVSVAPTPKGKVIFSSILASYITQLIGLTLLFIYTILVLKVDYGTNLPLIILLGIVGSLAGLSMGLAIGTILKSTENVKTGVVIAVTMLGCFLSGMMGITMKYIIDKNVPILNKINPASMITDGFYSLYYYNTLDRFYFNLVSLLIFSALLIAISIKGLRRQRYDNI